MSIGKQIVAVFLLVSAAWMPAWAVEIPARTNRYVNDYAEVLAENDEHQIERFLAELDQRTSNQIVVVTWPSLEGTTAEELTLQFAETWKPGQADRDNGVVVGVYPNDRQARIEVGYGLEGAIPDITAATILREEMIPAFQQGQWAQGIAAGVQALAKAAAGEYSTPAGRAAKLPPGIILLVILGILGFMLFVGASGRRYVHYGPRGRHGGWGGRGGGGGFGGFGGGGGGFGGGGASGRW